MIDDYNFTVNLSHDDPTSHPLKKSDTLLCKVTNFIPHFISPLLPKFDTENKFNFH